jgi:hypothetical protein
MAKIRHLKADANQSDCQVVGLTVSDQQNKTILKNVTVYQLLFLKVKTLT